VKPGSESRKLSPDLVWRREKARPALVLVEEEVPVSRSVCSEAVATERVAAFHPEESERVATATNT
jgi:hypothetical protein